MRNETKQRLKIYAIAIAIPLLVGGLSALLTMNNMQVYEQYQTPPLAPPSWLFPVVWTALYILMGVSSAMIWIRKKENRASSDTGLAFYAASLAFNFAWSILFFNFRWLLFAFLWLLVLLFLIIRTIMAYKPLSHFAAYLQIPYAVWVAFAGYLNLGIWLLNR